MNRTMILTAITSFALLVNGAANAAEPIYGGFKGGVNIANQSVDPSDSELSDSRTGMSLGGYVGIPVTPMFAVQPEALFTMKGDSESASGASGSVKLNYIEVPVLARISFMTDAAAHPAIYAGPSVGLNISAKAEGEDDTGSFEADIKDSVSPIDLGMVVGGGVTFPVGASKRNVGLDLRYTMGLSNVNDVEASDDDITNGVITIMGSVDLF